MTLRARLLAPVTVLAVMAAPLPVLAPVAHAVDVSTVGINNTRQGWNKFETVLTPANVPGLRKIREFNVDEKVDTTPLVVGDKLFVFTMKGTAYIFDVNTGAQLAKPRQLGFPFDPCLKDGNMDMWCVYHSWGISQTPVIDVATNTIYVTTFGKPNAGSDNQERNNMLWILDADTLADKKPPVLIAGDADNGGGGITNGRNLPYQKMRAGLGLLTGANGNKAVIIPFSMNGESPRGPGHGFVVAYDVRGLNRETGFTPTPAIWNVTPTGGAGGIWMSGSGPAIDGADIYFTTGNGMDPGTTPGNFAESFVKLHYTAGVANVNNGKPKLAVADFWGAFSDFQRSPQGQDQDLGSAGVFLVPERGNLVGGGKDGILYNLNKDNLGKNSWNPQFNLPFVATYFAPNAPPGLPDDDTGSIRTRQSSICDRNLHQHNPTGRPIIFTGHLCIWRVRRMGSCMFGGKMSASKHTKSTLLQKSSPRSAAKGHNSRPAKWPHPVACPADALSPPPTAPPTGRALSGPCTQRMVMRTKIMFPARSSLTTRRRLSTAPI